MKTSKFFFSTLIAAAAMTATAYAAELTTVATMEELIESGTIGSGVTQSTGYTSVSTVYDFAGSGSITGISNADVLSLVNQDSGWITIAAYVKPDAVSNFQSIFGYGAQQNGFKFGTSGSSLQFTNKGVADIAATGNDIVAGEWTLVAVTINLAENAGNVSRYLVGTGSNSYYTKDFGSWSTPAEGEQTFAIGSGNSTGDRELFTGSIANLTIFSSTERATNADVYAMLGDAPVVQIDTTGKLVWAGTADAGVWNATSENWLNDTITTTFTSGADVAFTDDAANKTVVVESGTTVTAGDVVVGGSGYVFKASSDTASISGKTLTISKGSTVQIGVSKYNTIGLAFDNIVLEGKLSYNNGSDTWSSLDLAGGELHIYDGVGGNATDLKIASVSVSKDSKITATWDKKLEVGVLSGSAELSMTGGSSGRLTVNILSVSSYTGTLVTNNGSWGLTVNLGAAEESVSSANVTMNSGDVNVVGKTTLNGVVTQKGGTLSIDADAVIGTLNVGTGSVSGVEGAKIGTLYFGDGSGANTTTLSGNLNITGNVAYATDVNGEILQLSDGAKVAVAGVFGTTAANAADWGQESSVLNVGNNASFSAGTIAHGDQLTVNLGSGASVSTGALTLNSVWGGKTHSFSGQGSENSKVSAEELNLNGNMTLALSDLRMDIGGISGDKAFSLTNAVLGITEASSGWATAGSVSMSGANSIDVSSGKSVEISGSLSGEGALIKSGEGMLTLSGDNSYTGGTTISAGSVVVTNSNALGTGAVTLNGGDLDLRADVEINELNGVGEKALKSDIVNVSRDEYTLRVRKGDTDAGIVGLTEHNDGSEPQRSYTLSLEKVGTADDKLSLRNYLAAKKVMVAGGTLSWAQEAIDGKLNWGAIEESLFVKSGAQFELVLSDSSKTEDYALYVGGDVNLASGAKIVVDLSNVTPGGEEIVLNIIAANAINFDWTETPEASIVSEGSSLEDFVAVKGNEHLAAYVNQVWSYNEGVLSLTLAIPEPSLFGVLAGLGALALVGTRRRRKKA